MTSLPFLAPLKKTTDRFSRINRRQRLYTYVRFTLTLTIAGSLVYASYALWLKDYLNTRVMLSEVVRLPTPKEVAEKKVIRPKYHSYDAHNVPFTVVAESSSEMDDEHVHFDRPSGMYQKNTLAPPMHITAQEGVFSKVSKQLDLKGGVTLHHGDLEIHTKNFSLDTGTREGQGTAPVTGQGATYAFQAGAFQLTQRGDEIHLTKGRTGQRPTIVLHDTSVLKKTTPKKNEAAA